MEITVLVADDDAVLRALVRDILAKEGFSVLEAADGRSAVDRFCDAGRVDLVVLDVMMPRLDGWDVLEEIRRRSDVPVLMLTALGDERHEVRGLRKGADDYVAKPFGYEVFVARVRALLRKTIQERSSGVETCGIRLDPTTRRVDVDGEPVELNRKEFTLLSYFLHNRNRVLTREQILDAVWGRDYEGDIRTIDTHVRMLRARLGARGDRIATVRGVGYRFEEEKG
jgi:two-component system, OmpR family, response regulator ResD